MTGAPESIADLLAAQDTDALQLMRQSLNDRMMSIHVELEMIDRELEKRFALRSRSGKRLSGLKREHVLAALRRLGPSSPPALTELIKEDGFEVTTNAVRNHLVRLVEDGDATKFADGRYSAASKNGHSGPLAQGRLDQARVGTT